MESRISRRRWSHTVDTLPASSLEQWPASLERVIARALSSVAMTDTEAFESARVSHADLPAPDVSVVVTVYNEAGSLEELYRRAVAVLDPGPRTFELIFVDDGSTDGTFAAIERLHAGDPRVRGVRFKRNFGQHPRCTPGWRVRVATSS